MTMFIGGALTGPFGGPASPFGRTRDLSRSGLFVLTEARPAIGSRVPLSIVWGDDTCACDATVVRHADEGIGLSFIEASPRFRYVIEEILKDAERAPPLAAAGTG